MIRTAQIAAAEGIAAVHVDAWRETYRGIVPDEILDQLSYERRAELWKRSIGERHQCLFVAEDLGRIAGFVSAGAGREAPGGFDSEIYAIYLLRAHQGRGTGTAHQGGHQGGQDETGGVTYLRVPLAALAPPPRHPRPRAGRREGGLAPRRTLLAICLRAPAHRARCHAQHFELYE
jgi:Acetyltransferase (GNAT) family